MRLPAASKSTVSEFLTRRRRRKIRKAGRWRTGLSVAILSQLAWCGWPRLITAAVSTAATSDRYLRLRSVTTSDPFFAFEPNGPTFPRLRRGHLHWPGGIVCASTRHACGDRHARSCHVPTEVPSCILYSSLLLRRSTLAADPGGPKFFRRQCAARFGPCPMGSRQYAPRLSVAACVVGESRASLVACPFGPGAQRRPAARNHWLGFAAHRCWIPLPRHWLVGLGRLCPRARASCRVAPLCPPRHRRWGNPL